MSVIALTQDRFPPRRAVREPERDCPSHADRLIAEVWDGPAGAKKGEWTFDDEAGGTIPNGELVAALGAESSYIPKTYNQRGQYRSLKCGGRSATRSPNADSGAEAATERRGHPGRRLGSVGDYSVSADACTWPCTITQMDDTDQRTPVYEALGFWAEVVLIFTSIRWGAPGALYSKMIERMNCIQNQVTTHDQVLIRNTVAAPSSGFPEGPPSPCPAARNRNA